MNYSAYTKIYETKTTNGIVFLTLIGEGEPSRVDWSKTSPCGSVIPITDAEVQPAKHATQSTHLFFRDVETRREYTGVLVGCRACVDIDGAKCCVDMSGVMA